MWIGDFASTTVVGGGGGGREKGVGKERERREVVGGEREGMDRK